MHDWQMCLFLLVRFLRNNARLMSGSWCSERAVCTEVIFMAFLIIVSDFHIKVSIVLDEVNRTFDSSPYMHICVCVKILHFSVYVSWDWMNNRLWRKATPTHTHTPIVHFIAATKQGRPVKAKKKDNEVTDDVLRYVRMHNELYKYVPCQASYFYTQIRSCVHKMAF